MSRHHELSDDDYRRLRDFRVGLRRFLHWSGEQAARAGLTPSHHQLLLSIRAHDDPRGPTIGEAADQLLLKHHSAVELVDRAVQAGLVRREADDRDHRQVRLRLTGLGARRLEELAALHIEELTRVGPRFAALWKGLDRSVRTG